MIKEDKYFNNLEMNINIFKKENNGIIIYNKYKIIYYKIIKNLK